MLKQGVVLLQLGPLLFFFLKAMSFCTSDPYDGMYDEEVGQALMDDGRQQFLADRLCVAS